MSGSLKDAAARVIERPADPDRSSRPWLHPVLEADLRGLLGMLYNSSNINEIAVNGPENLWAKLAGHGWYRVDSAGLDLSEKWATGLGIHLANIESRRYDPDRWPLLSARLPGDHRVQLVTGGAARSKLVLAIRVQRKIQFGFDAFGLDAASFLPADPSRQPGSFDSGFKVGTLDDLAAVAMQGLPILVSGGTDSGKTNFLKALLSSLPAHRRILTIEDVAEVNLDRFPNAIGLLAEPAGSAGQDRVGYAELMKAATRLNPDQIVQGEIQPDGAMAAYRMLNTGHDGFMATLHADSPLDALEAWRTMLAIAMKSSSSAAEALAVIARKIARIVQLGPGKKVVEIGRPIDLDWRRLLRG